MPIPSIQQHSYEEARERQAHLSTPPGGLGQLADLACWMAARQGKNIPEAVKPHIVVFAADHAVAEEGLSEQPQAMTALSVRNMAAGQSAINVLAGQCGAELDIVDVGVNADLSDLDNIRHAKVRMGAGHMVHESAMTQEEYWQAVGVGEDMANKAIDHGAGLLIAGDVGVGNSMPSAALICELGGVDVEEVVGRTGEKGDSELVRKQALVEQALARASGTPSNDMLREFGGLEIAAMAGFYRASASRGIPVLLDGFTSAAAALAAVAWDVRISGWMLASHMSDQAGHRRALDELGLLPWIDFGLRTGEAVGAALFVPILNAALAMHSGIALKR